MVIHFYGLWVVYVFVHEIQEERKAALDNDDEEVASKNGFHNPTLTMGEDNKS
jgi:hypothetical protein